MKFRERNSFASAPLAKLGFAGWGVRVYNPSMGKLKEVTFVEIDRMLKEMLEELKLERKISIDDVKNVIYHEEDLMGAMKLAGGFMPYAKKKKQLDLMVKVLQTAWNYLPHKSLDGLSPHQKAALAKEPKYNSSKTSIYQLFESGLPKQTKLIKLRKGEWGFEFSARYLEIKEQFNDRMTVEYASDS